MRGEFENNFLKIFWQSDSAHEKFYRGVRGEFKLYIFQKCVLWVTNWSLESNRNTQWHIQNRIFLVALFVQIRRTDSWLRPISKKKFRSWFGFKNHGGLEANEPGSNLVRDIFLLVEKQGWMLAFFEKLKKVWTNFQYQIIRKLLRSMIIYHLWEMINDVQN